MTKITNEMRKTGIKFETAKDNSDKSRVGIHLLNPDNNEIWNAINACDKDGFSTIWLHTDATWYKTRYSLLDKQHFLNSLNSWIEKIQKSPGGQYQLEKLGLTQDYKSTINSMTCKQLKLILSLVAGSYSSGCDNTRDHFRSMRDQEVA